MRQAQALAVCAWLGPFLQRLELLTLPRAVLARQGPFQVLQAHRVQYPVANIHSTLVSAMLIATIHPVLPYLARFPAMQILLSGQDRLPIDADGGIIPQAALQDTLAITLVAGLALASPATLALVQILPTPVLLGHTRG